MLFGDSGYWWIENLYMIVGRLFVNRHDDRGGNPVPTGGAMPTGGAKGLDSDHVPTGGAETFHTSAGRNNGDSGRLLDILHITSACTVSFLSYHSLRCNNLILGVSYPWDIERPRFIRSARYFRIQFKRGQGDEAWLALG